MTERRRTGLVFQKLLLLGFAPGAAVYLAAPREAKDALRRLLNRNDDDLSGGGGETGDTILGISTQEVGEAVVAGLIAALIVALVIRRAPAHV